MEKEFVTYEQALALKELGFNDKCIKYWVGEIHEKSIVFVLDSEKLNDDELLSPLKQQVFRWFREKYNFLYNIFPLQISASTKTGYRFSWEIYNYTPEWLENDDSLLGYYSFEEAEDDCINKLIELAKQQKI